MTIEETYLLYLQIVERNFTNDNIDVDKSRFVLSFNFIQNLYSEWILEKRNEDDLRDLQQILVLDKKLTSSGTVLNHIDFDLPRDYFNHSSVQVYGSKGKCKNSKIFTFEVKNDDVEEYLADCFNQPSFEYRESFYTINDDKISIYFDNFSIDGVYLSYYRYPNPVDIAGYLKPDGSNSTSIDSEFSDRIVERILIAMAKNFAAINDDVNKYQLNKDLLFSRI